MSEAPTKRLNSLALLKENSPAGFVPMTEVLRAQLDEQEEIKALQQKLDDAPENVAVPAALIRKIIAS